MLENIDLYLKELGKPHYPTAEEETQMFLALRNGDTGIKEQIVKGYIRLVMHTARRYVNTAEFEDLVQEGTIGLLRAIDYFDMNKGARFTTYAMFWIRQTIIRSLWNSRLIYLPDNKQEKLWGMQKMRDKLLLELEREPTTQELSRALDLPEDVIEVIARTNEFPYSLDRPTTEGSEETLSDLIPDPDEYDVFPNVDRTTLLKALTVLSEREQTILKMHYGLTGGRYSFQEIGATFGLTKQRVRQIEARALEKLQKVIQKSEFAVLAVC